MKDNERRKREVVVASREELLGKHSTKREDVQRVAQQKEVNPPKSQLTTEKKVKNKKKKRRNKVKMFMRLMLVIAVFVAIAAIVFTGLGRLFSGSKGTVRRAYAKTMKVYEDRENIFAEILGKDAIKLLDKGNVSQGFTLNLTDNTAGVQSIGLSGALNKSTASKTADAQLAATYKDVSVAQLKMFTDNEIMMFSAPGMYDDWLKIDCENVMTQLSNSALAENVEFSSDEDFSLKLFEDEQTQGEVVLSLTEELAQIFTDEMDRLSKKAEYTKLKEKKAVAIDGEEKNCRGYQLEIKGEDFKNFLVNVLSEVRTNKKVRKILTQYAQFQYDNIQVFSMLFESPEYMVDSYYDQMDEALEKLNVSSFTDTGAVVYLYKGIIADFDFNTTYIIDKDKMQVNLKGGMNGGKRAYEDVNLALTLSDEAQTLSVSYAEATDEIDSTVTNNRAFVLGNGTENLTLTTQVTFDRSTSLINGNAQLVTPSGGHIDINGSGNLVKEKGATRIDAQEIKLDYNGAFTLVMAGSYEVKPLDGKPEQPQGNVIELFKADKAQLDKIVGTLDKNLGVVVGKVNEALESMPTPVITDEAAENGETTETTTETAETTTAAQE